MVFNWDARFTDRTPRQLDDLRARYHPDYRYPPTAPSTAATGISSGAPRCSRPC
jgi:hypothetical protein